MPTAGLQGGYRLTYYRVVQKAWLVGGPSRIKDFLKKCSVCALLNAKPMNQAMASLPAARVIPSFPFTQTGIDYAGPFQVLRSKGRGSKSVKSYIALFVCLSTKAIYLELVGDLTTSSFLGALARLVNRRGKPNEMWNDRGTNLSGAKNELQNLLEKEKLDWKCEVNNLAQHAFTGNLFPLALHTLVVYGRPA